ncbi:MAG: lysine--tRNA ligase [Pyrinomonadaceae bacterium]
MDNSFIEDNDQTRARREHLEALRGLVGNVYPNKFARSRVTGDEDTITAIIENFKSHAPDVKEKERPAPEVIEAANAELNKIEVRLSGRIATPPRVMGKAAFVHLSDGVSRLQIYVRRADVTGKSNDAQGGDVDGWQLFNLLDHGDFIGVAGYLFITKTGELSVHVRELYFLAKALLPMPDKMHGISDPEIRQRQRYADLIAGSLKVTTEEEEQALKDGKPKELSPREVFELRSKLIREMRRHLDDHGYLEVETPMLTPKATGAAAKPFETHHNALDIKLYARIAPELYLKRLVVGGFEKVYELNRNFRNEGISTRHNPEFTMLEFYAAYMDVNGMMDFCEEMLRTTIKTATGSEIFDWYDLKIDFSKAIPRLTMKDAVIESLKGAQHLVGGKSRDFDQFKKPENEDRFRIFLDTFENGIPGISLVLPDGFVLAWDKAFGDRPDTSTKESHIDDATYARQLEHIFSSLVEANFEQPTFITGFPKLISPLSKASPIEPLIAERFELFIGQMECANGFSELNDPVEQEARFVEQMRERERGDEEAMVLDEDYIRALHYGMPPAAGIGIGIDRLVMILTGKRSIRDVILFPHLRPERRAEDPAETTEAKE